MKVSFKKFIALGVIGVCALITVLLVVNLVSSLRQYEKANAEYNNIVEQYVTEKETPNKTVMVYSGVGTTEVMNSTVALDTNSTVDNQQTVQLPNLTIDFQSLLNTNKDCIAWLHVPGTKINYPVVQSADNIDYVSKTFSGEENIAGCVFSDCRIVSPFTQKTILYGHNMKNGTMFHDLFKMETDSSLNIIWIILPDGTMYSYEVESIKRVGMLDTDVYSISPTYSDTLVLSTCIKNDTRLVVTAKRSGYFYA